MGVDKEVSASTQLLYAYAEMNLRYLLARTIRFILSLYIIATITFFLLKLAPGEPLAHYINPYTTPEQIEILKRQFGLDKSLHVQYFRYLLSISSLEFGRSLRYKQNVTDLIAEKIPNTLLLTIPSLLVTYLLGITWGMIAAWKRGSRFEQGSILVVLTGRSAPMFWIGMVAISIFCFQFGWFPSSGITSPGVYHESILGKIFSIDFIRHLALPLVTYVFFLLGLPFLIMRSNMLENINKDFITMHKFCGLGTGRTIFRAARNSLLPVVTVVALGVGYIFGGAPVIETVFSWPGVGLLLVSAVVCLDYPLAQACFLLIAASVLFLNFVADILYGVLDPRISAQRRFK